MPKVHEGGPGQACHPHQVKEHKKLVNWRGWYLATSCGFIGKSCHMCFEKEQKCSKINKKCQIWRCYAPYISNLTSNLNFSCNFGTWNNIQAKYVLICGHKWSQSKNWQKRQENGIFIRRPCIMLRIIGSYAPNISFLGSCQLPTCHEQAPGAQILKKYSDAQKSESFHPPPSGTHCALSL